MNDPVRIKVVALVAVSAGVLASFAGLASAVSLVRLAYGRATRAGGAGSPRRLAATPTTEAAPGAASVIDLMPGATKRGVPGWRRG